MGTPLDQIVKDRVTAERNRTMEGIQEIAKATASCLEETLITETVDFIVDTSLEILPLDQRRDGHENLDLEPVRRRERQFNILMRYLASSFVQDKGRTFGGAQRTMVVALRKTDEALVPKFTKLMQAWKSYKAGSTGVVSDSQASSSQFLDPPNSHREILEPKMLEPRQSDHGLEFTFMPSKQFFGLQEVQKMDDLTNAFANAFTEPRVSIRPPDILSANVDIQTPDISLTQQQPSEANAFGVEIGDAVLVGHPPEYPPGLLDWESPEDDDEFEELVSNRQARVAAQAPASAESDNIRRNERDNSKSSKAFEPESDDEWVCI